MARQIEPVIVTAMVERILPPGPDEIERLAVEALQSLPEFVRSAIDGLLIKVEPFADDETLSDLGIETPFELLGLYQGQDLAHRGSGDIVEDVDKVFLYWRPILDYWIETGEPLDRIVRHVLVHEIGHHFGFSDDDMARIEGDT